MQNFENCLVPAQALARSQQPNESDGKGFKPVQSHRLSSGNHTNYERSHQTY